MAVRSQMEHPTEFKLAFKAATTILALTKGSIITTGVGKSGHIARKVSSSMLSVGIPAYYLHPTDAEHGDLGMARPGDSLLVFTHSGGSTELRAIFDHAAWLGAPRVVITSNPASPLALSAECRIVYPAVDEAIFRAPTTSSTQQIVLGDMLTVAIAECRGITPEDFSRNHPGGAIGRGRDA